MTSHCRDRGAAAVEFALIVPILIALIVGIAAFGRAYNIQSSLSMAAREGVRVMAIERDTGPGLARAVAAANELGLNATATLGAGSDDCIGSGVEYAKIKVQTTYDFFGLSGFFGGPITMTGTGVMRCGG